MSFDAPDAAKGSPQRMRKANFRCRTCDDLFEVEYPWSEGAPESEGVEASYSASRPVPKNRPNPGRCGISGRSGGRRRWRIDQSGVWRFRDLLPIVPYDQSGDAARGEYAAV